MRRASDVKSAGDRASQAGQAGLFETAFGQRRDRTACRPETRI